MEEIEITIDLREGFDNDRVVIEVNGAEIYRAESVRTDYSIGLADIVRATCPPGIVRCEAAVPNRRLHAEYETEVEQPLFLTVRIDPAGSLTITPADEPRIFM
jgi:hypothetical protein